MVSPGEIISDDTACKPTNASSLVLQMGYFLEKAERDCTVVILLVISSININIDIKHYLHRAVCKTVPCVVKNCLYCKSCIGE